MKTINDDINLSNYNGKVLSTNGDLDLRECNGIFSTVNGDIELCQCSGSVYTTNGEIHVANSSLEEIETNNGDIILVESNVDKVKTINGKIKLRNTIVKKMEAYDVSGKGVIEHLILPERISFIKSNFNVFNPLSWFNCINSKRTSIIESGSNSINISCNGNISVINDKVFVNGKEYKKR